MGKDQVPLDEPENPLHPCWTDIFDSQTAFDSAVDHFHEWYEHMSNKIRNLHQKETETRIRFTGIHFSQAHLKILNLANFDKIGLILKKKVQNYILVALTLRFSRTRDNIDKLIEEALEKLDADGKLCSELSCICNQQYPKCPQINFIS